LFEMNRLEMFFLMIELLLFWEFVAVRFARALRVSMFFFVGS